MPAATDLSFRIREKTGTSFRQRQSGLLRHPSFLYFILHIIKEALAFASASSLNQRLPILPGGLPPSTFGVCGLNCCVRHGNRWIPAAIATEFGSGFVS